MKSHSVNWYSSWGKRVFDIVASALMLTLLLPVLAVTALLVKIDSGRPVLFRQQRPGRHGKPFTIYKFRTMTDARDAQGILLPDAERLTALGRFLRRTSLDELPELWNVLKGDMSLVGPRPLLMRYIPYFNKSELARFDVRPGITGLAQICGRNDLSWDSRIAMDVRYAQTWSLRLDLYILLLTVVRVLRRQGMQVDPGATMLDFDQERRLRVQTTRGNNSDS